MTTQKILKKLIIKKKENINNKSVKFDIKDENKNNKIKIEDLVKKIKNSNNKNN